MDIFTLQKKIQADKEVRKIIESGEVPVVDLSIFDCLDNLNISDDNKRNAEKTIHTKYNIAYPKAKEKMLQQVRQ